MLKAEESSGVVEWRKGLLVLHSTAAFAKNILPRYFNTRNFKTFRRQLNYYGFVHVRSFSTTGSTTTALWVNQALAESANADIESVLLLKRVEPCESQKTAEARRVRKELALHTVEEDLGVNAKTLQLDQIRSLALRGSKETVSQSIPREISIETSTSTSDPGRNGSVRALPSPSPCQVSSDEESGVAASLLLMLSQSG